MWKELLLALDVVPAQFFFLSLSPQFFSTCFCSLLGFHKMRSYILRCNRVALMKPNYVHQQWRRWQHIIFNEYVRTLCSHKSNQILCDIFFVLLSPYFVQCSFLHRFCLSYIQRCEILNLELMKQDENKRIDYVRENYTHCTFDIYICACLHRSKNRAVNVGVVVSKKKSFWMAAYTVTTKQHKKSFFFFSSLAYTLQQTKDLRYFRLVFLFRSVFSAFESHTCLVLSISLFYLRVSAYCLVLALHWIIWTKINVVTLWSNV